MRPLAALAVAVFLAAPTAAQESSSSTPASPPNDPTTVGEPQVDNPLGPFRFNEAVVLGCRHAVKDVWERLPGNLQNVFLLSSTTLNVEISTHPASAGPVVYASNGGLFVPAAECHAPMPQLAVEVGHALYDLLGAVAPEARGAWDAMYEEIAKANLPAEPDVQYDAYSEQSVFLGSEGMAGAREAFAQHLLRRVYGRDDLKSTHPDLVRKTAFLDTISLK